MIQTPELLLTDSASFYFKVSKLDLPRPNTFLQRHLNTFVPTIMIRKPSLCVQTVFTAGPKLANKDKEEPA